MKLFILICLFSTQVFANECKSLFSDLATTNRNIEIEIQELHILKEKSYDPNPNTARIANILFNKKVKELKAHISIEEIKARLKGVKSNAAELVEQQNELRIQQAKIISDHELVVEFIRSMGLVDVNSHTISGDNILGLAIQKNKNNLIEPILKEGLDVNSGTFAALYQASKLGNMEAVEILLANGAEINVLPAISNPLYAAIRNGHKGIVIKLIERGANPNLVSGDKSSELGNSLYYAGRYARNDMIDLLLERGALKFIEGYPSAIHGAAQGDNVEMVEYLLSKGFEINAKDGNGLTPLHRVQSKKMAQYLLDNGADPTIKSRFGDTPEQFINLNDYESTANIVYLLREKQSFSYKTYLKAKKLFSNYLNSRGNTK